MYSRVMQISLAADMSRTSIRRSDLEIDTIIRDARPWLYRLALSITSSPEVAEDVAQEALIRATRSREKLRNIIEPRAWLRSVVVRCAITALSQRTDVSGFGETTNNDPTDSMAVRQILCRMEPMDRAILALAHFEELSYAEIGLSLDIPVGTVASRLHAAREAFRKEWRK